MRRNLTRVLVVLSLLMLATSAAAADVVGRWRTIDDQTKQAKSIVEISRAADGTYTGRIVELLRPSRPNPICDKCRDDRRNRPIIGMEIIRGMRKDGGSWSGGSILNPDEGKVYRSKMQLIDGGDKLEVSGCIAVFCKSQIWIRQQ